MQFCSGGRREVIDHIPGEYTATAFSEDTWSVGEMLAGFVVETILTPRGNRFLLSLSQRASRPVKTAMVNVNRMPFKTDIYR